ncbi:hypothetical protein H3H54_15520 [Brachybacterium sp. Z12]|nr:hypothetical protein H3H54_15520 [Brachybacterium sp. Z12]
MARPAPRSVDRGQGHLWHRGTALRDRDAAAQGHTQRIHRDGGPAPRRGRRHHARKAAPDRGRLLRAHPPFTAPKNPWDSSRWVGASSSGSGVATAAGLVPAALGSDTGGSIRIPCSAAGVSGLKPTWGRVSRHGIFPFAATLDHPGPMARTVADTGLLLQVMAGHDPQDPSTSLEPVPNLSPAPASAVRGAGSEWTSTMRTRASPRGRESAG